MSDVYLDPKLAAKRAEDQKVKQQQENVVAMTAQVEALADSHMPMILKAFETRTKEMKIKSASLALERATKKRIEMYQLLNELEALKRARDVALGKLRATEEYQILHRRYEAAKAAFKVDRTEKGTIPSIFPKGAMAQLIDQLGAQLKDLEGIVHEVFDPEIEALEGACADALALRTAEQLEWAQRS